MPKKEPFNLGNYITDAVPELSALPAVQGSRTLEVIGAEIREHTVSFEYHRRGTIYEAVEIGRRLTEARDIAPHGTWLDFLKRETAFSHDKANNLIKVFEAYGEQQKSLFGTEVSNSDTYRNLSFSKALALLALPEGERETFVETHDVEKMSTRELREVIRERDEARQALDTMQADVDKATERARKAEDEAKAATDTANKAAEEIESLRAQIKELESRPVDVAVMSVDQEALEKARAEAVAEMQKRLDKAKAAKAKAEEKRGDAEAALKIAKMQLAEAAKAQKQAEISADKELASFEVFFLQGQELANKMRGILLKIRGREDQATAGKLEKAIRALGEAIGRAAE